MANKQQLPSYRSLQESLKCANAEASGYLKRLKELEGVVKERDSLKREVYLKDRAVAMLCNVIELYQRHYDGK